MTMRLMLLLACSITFAAQQPLDRAWELSANGRAEEAVQLLYQLIKTDPKNADARLLLGSLLMEQGQKVESIDQLTAAERLRPSSEEVQNALGEACNKFGDTAGARAAFEKAISLKPDYGIAQSNLGQVLLAAGDVSSAAKHLDRAISLLGQSDDAADAHYLRAKAYTAQGEAQQAARELDQSIAIRPNFAEAWSDLGQARRTLLDNPGALAAFQRAAALNPRDAVAQYRLGAEYLRQATPHLAVECLQKAYQLDPSDQSTLNALQLALRQDGDPEAAKRVKQRLAELLRERDRISQNQLTAVRLNNEGALLEKSGNLREAIEKYREASRLYPEHIGIHINYGVALLRIGEWNQGLTELHTALLRDPNNAQLKAALKDALAQAPRDAKPEWGREPQ